MDLHPTDNYLLSYSTIEKQQAEVGQLLPYLLLPSKLQRDCLPARFTHNSANQNYIRRFQVYRPLRLYNGLGLHTTRLLCYTRISPLHVHEDCWYYRWFPRLPHLRPFGLLLTEPSIAPRTPIAVFESDNLSTTTCSYIRPVSYITSLLCVRLYQSIPCLDPVRSSCLSTSCLLALH